MAKFFPDARGKPWSPKYPEFATERRATPEDEEASGSGWVNAPADSHVARFQLLDNPKGLVEKFQGALIHVEFKIPTRQGMTLYRYFFGRDFERARSVFAMLQSAAHPGEIVHSELIEKRVRYEAYG